MVREAMTQKEQMSKLTEPEKIKIPPAEYQVMRKVAKHIFAVTPDDMLQRDLLAWFQEFYRRGYSNGKKT